ncbi:MAG: DUF1653 domain-containing protein [Lachnospiraceae bacterium]|nr:DUF1653 domain-containing protein [Lachnospiraceae bacterium]
MSFIPKPHEIYKHFKGNLYQIVTIAQHSETGEQMVVYQALYDDFKTYVRPLDMFVGYVDKVKYPQVTQEFRFELQGSDSDRQRRQMQTEEAIEDENTVGAEKAVQTEPAMEELHIDPMVLEFLDADSYEQRLNILAGLHHRITNEMITTMAIACDIEVTEGDIEERYESLKSCLLTLEKYECNRLR